MNRFNKTKSLHYEVKKTASFGEADLELNKLRETERRAGITIEDFEASVQEFVRKHGDEEFDLRTLLIREMFKERGRSEEPFYTPYDYITSYKTPEEYVFYLLENNLIALRKPAISNLVSTFGGRL